MRDGLPCWDRRRNLHEGRGESAGTQGIGDTPGEASSDPPDHTPQRRDQPLTPAGCVRGTAIGIRVRQRCPTRVGRHCHVGCMWVALPGLRSCVSQELSTSERMQARAGNGFAAVGRGWGRCLYKPTPAMNADVTEGTVPAPEDAEPSHAMEKGDGVSANGAMCPRDEVLSKASAASDIAPWRGRSPSARIFLLFDRNLPQKASGGRNFVFLRPKFCQNASDLGGLSENRRRHFGAFLSLRRA